MTKEDKDGWDKIKEDLKNLANSFADVLIDSAEEGAKKIEEGVLVAEKGAASVKEFTDITEERINNRLKQAIGFYPIALRIGLPISILATFLLIVSIFSTSTAIIMLNSIWLYIIPIGALTVFGMLSVIGVNIFLNITWMILLEAMIALLILLNLNYLIKIPRIGKYLLRSQAKGRVYMKKYRWLGKTAFGAVVLVSSLPFSNAVIGALTGKIVGLRNWKTLTAILAGGLIRFGIAATIGWGIL